MLRQLCAALGSFGLLACGGSRPALLAEVDDAGDLADAVAAVIPLGAELGAATDTLEGQGFSCPTLEREPFTPWSQGCYWRSGGRFALARREFRVLLISRDTFGVHQPPQDTIRVDAIFATGWLTGP